MTSPDRLLPICEILLGAAHADGRLDRREQETVRELLSELAGGALPALVEQRIKHFDPKKFDLKKAAAPFRGDSLDDRKRLLYLADAITEADEELDLAENGFLKALAAALELPADALAGLTVDVEVEELADSLAAVRKGPPPIPGKAAADDVDVDLD
jgi:uncharacterized membrane protein YebE (DUF533 family)